MTSKRQTALIIKHLNKIGTKKSMSFYDIADSVGVDVEKVKEIFMSEMLKERVYEVDKIELKKVEIAREQILIQGELKRLFNTMLMMCENEHINSVDMSLKQAELKFLLEILK